MVMERMFWFTPDGRHCRASVRDRDNEVRNMMRIARKRYDVHKRDVYEMSETINQIRGVVAITSAVLRSATDAICLLGVDDTCWRLAEFMKALACSVFTRLGTTEDRS